MTICPYCRRSDRQVKAGTNKGEQRYKCMHCVKRYIPTARQRSYPSEIRQDAVRLHAEGLTALEIGRRLGVSSRNVSNWILKQPQESAEAESFDPRVQEQDKAPMPRKARPTAMDVAGRAGVSVTTVSNYINNKGGMSKATRQRIETAIKEMHFTPNSLVRAIRQRRTRVLGLQANRMYDLDSRMDVSLTPPMLAGIDAAASEAEHDILIYTGWPRQLRYNGLNFLNGQIDGLIWFAPETEREVMKVVAAGGLPVVALLTRHVPASIGYVNGDNLRAMHMLVDHLTDLGRTRMAYFGAIGTSNMADRRTGYRTALSAHGLPMDPDLEVVDNRVWKTEYLENSIERLLNLHSPPDAFITAGDDLADQAIASLRRRGVRVPEDIAVTGFDDVPAARWFGGGGLTTIRQPFRKISETAVHLLLSMIEGTPAKDCQVTLPMELIVRNSTIGHSE